MTASGAKGRDTQDRDATATRFGAVIFAAVALSLIVPRSASWLLPLVALAGLWAYRPALEDLRQSLAGSAAVLPLLLFLLYGFINATWSLDRPEAFSKVGITLAYLLLALAVVAALAHASARDGGRLSLMLAAGAVAGAAVFAFEVLTQQALEETLLVPLATRPYEPHTNDLNRNAGLLLLLFWPVLLAMLSLSRAFRLWLGGLFLAATLAGVGGSNHETSMIALLASALVFAAARWRPALARWGLIALWCAAFALVIPTVTAAYKAELHLADWMPRSLQARVILWNQTATRVPEAPILGIGVRSTRVLDAAQREHAIKPDGFPYALRTGRHAHSFFLQTWYEMGLVGVLLFAAAGVAVIRALSRLPMAAQPFAFAQFTAFTVIAAAAWGMWQSWLMAGIGLSAIYMAVALVGERRAGS